MTGHIKCEVPLSDGKSEDRCIDIGDKRLIFLEQRQHRALQGPPDRQADLLGNGACTVNLKGCGRKRKEKQA